MIAVLRDPSHSLSAQIAAAPSTTAPQFVMNFLDQSGEEYTLAGSISNSATQLLAGVVAKRYTVESLNIYNADSAAVVVTIVYVVANASFGLFSQTLQSGSTFRIDGSGVYAVTSS